MINLFWSIPHCFFHNAIACPELSFIFKYQHEICPQLTVSVKLLLGSQAWNYHQFLVYFLSARWSREAHCSDAWDPPWLAEEGHHPQDDLHQDGQNEGDECSHQHHQQPAQRSKESLVRKVSAWFYMDPHVDIDVSKWSSLRWLSSCGHQHHQQPAQRSKESLVRRVSARFYMDPHVDIDLSKLSSLRWLLLCNHQCYIQPAQRREENLVRRVSAWIYMDPHVDIDLSKLSFLRWLSLCNHQCYIQPEVRRTSARFYMDPHMLTLTLVNCLS